MGFEQVSDETLPGVVVSPSIWWGSHSPGGTCVNTTTPDGEADLGGGATFYSNWVEVEKDVVPVRSYRRTGTTS